MPLNTEDKRTPTGITLHPEKTASYPSTPEKLQGGTGVGREGGAQDEPADVRFLLTCVR